MEHHVLFGGGNVSLFARAGLPQILHEFLNLLLEGGYQRVELNLYVVDQGLNLLLHVGADGLQLLLDLGDHGLQLFLELPARG